MLRPILLVFLIALTGTIGCGGEPEDQSSDTQPVFEATPSEKPTMPMRENVEL